MNPEQNEANRNVIIGRLKEQKPNMKVVECKDSKGQDRTVYVPNACVADTVTESDGVTVFLLQDAEVNGVSIGVKSGYSYSTNGDAALQSIADMWIEFGETNQPTEDLPSISIDDEEPLPSIGIDEDLPSISIADDEEDLPSIDDETPNFNESIGIELADALLGEGETVEDAKEKEAKQKLTAAQKAQKLRQERFEASEELKKSLNTDVSKALADGKRHEDFGAWNFHTETYDTVIRKTDPITGEHSYHEIKDGKGDTRVRVLVNPTIVDEENPLGVVLNRAIGPNFEPVEHPSVFIPVIETVRGINMANGCVYDSEWQLQSGTELITWDAFSFNKGARAMLNLDLTGWGAKTRNAAASGLSNFGYVNLSANRISDMLVEEQGGHRIGVSIINAHDGKQALQSFMSVLRTYCGNLAMRGGVQDLLMDGNKSKIRHMKGAVASYDPELFAERLGGALEESYKHLIAMNILRHLPIEANLFDKVLTSFASHGLVKQPSLTIQAGDIDQLPKDKNGNLVINAAVMTKDAVRVGHGHAYNAMMQGWMNPDHNYVALETEEDKQAIGTMFHAAQVLSGTITHNPIFSDGKRTLSGNTQGVETMMKKSEKACSLIEQIAMAAVDTYAKAMAKEVQVGTDENGSPIYEVQVQPVDDLEAMGQWFSENPSALKLPAGKKMKGKNSFSKPTMQSVDEIPVYAETWDYTIQQPKVVVKK